MPTINVYWKTNLFSSNITNELIDYSAKLLSCNELELTKNEISIRFIWTSTEYMIAEIEIEIMSHAFPERVKKQDLICNKIRDFLLSKIKWARDIRVRLLLSELGHSW